MKLLDFGIAAQAGNPRPITQTGMVIGTLAYLAPELLAAGRWPAAPDGFQRDVFAFGVVGYELLTGVHPAGIDVDSTLGAFLDAARRGVDGGGGGVRAPVAQRGAGYHGGAERDDSRAHGDDPALLAAFPAQALVPLPASGTIVGRNWLADAGLSDTKVSSGHLRFTRAGGRLQIEDVGSRNGTWIQDQRLPQGERVPLQDGAVLRIGGTLLVYREAYAGPAQPGENRTRAAERLGLSRPQLLRLLKAMRR